MDESLTVNNPMFNPKSNTEDNPFFKTNLTDLKAS